MAALRTDLDELGGQRGLFLVLEGLDGSGTTTQAGRLAAWLRTGGRQVEQTREPSTGPVGGVIRTVLDGRMSVVPPALALMFAADRVDHLHQPGGIVDALRRGVSVVSDRYVLSSLAYQSAQGLPVQWLSQINAAAVAPDATVYIDVTVDTCLQRIGARSDRAELFHEREQLVKIDSGYRQVLARGELTGGVISVDGEADPDSVARQIRDGLVDLAAKAPDSPLAARLPPGLTFP